MRGATRASSATGGGATGGLVFSIKKLYLHQLRAVFVIAHTF
jgi:hypothetical protein